MNKKCILLCALQKNEYKNHTKDLDLIIAFTWTCHMVYWTYKTEKERYLSRKIFYVSFSSYTQIHLNVWRVNLVDLIVHYYNIDTII